MSVAESSVYAYVTIYSILIWMCVVVCQSELFKIQFSVVSMQKIFCCSVSVRIIIERVS